MSAAYNNAPAVGGRGVGNVVSGQRRQTNLSPVDTFAQLLPGPVRKSGKGWRTNCTGVCDDRKGALSFTEGGDGRLLLHCFKQCSAADVLAGVGLTLADLYPERLAPQTPEERRSARRAMQEAGWRAVLPVLDTEATVALIAARMVRAGKRLTDDDDARLVLACNRIESAKGVLCDR